MLLERAFVSEFGHCGDHSLLLLMMASQDPPVVTHSRDSSAHGNGVHRGHGFLVCCCVGDV